MDSESNQELLSPDAKNHLFAAGSWARFIGIIGFLFTAFFAVTSLALIVGGSTVSSMLAAANPDNPSSNMIKSSGPFIGMLYLIITAICFVISWWTFKFGTEIKEGLKENSSDHLTSSFYNLKNYFQAYGVFMLIAISMVLFSLITVLMSGFFSLKV